MRSFIAPSPSPPPPRLCPLLAAALGPRRCSLRSNLRAAGATRTNARCARREGVRRIFVSRTPAPTRIHHRATLLPSWKGRTLNDALLPTNEAPSFFSFPPILIATSRLSSIVDEIERGRGKSNGKCFFLVRERFVRFGYSSNGLNRFGNSCSQPEWSPSKARGIEESRSGLITKLLGFYAGNDRGTIAAVHREGRNRLANPTATFAERNASLRIRQRW